MRRIECWAIALALCAPWVGSNESLADVRLPKIFGDQMVLQQGVQNSFWGTADAGEQVTVTIGETKGVANAGADGRWMVKIAAPPVGGPYVVSIAGKNSITLKDVLCGEVWICSGQSNMQWPVQRANDGPNEINAANHPKLRLFQVDRRIADSPQTDCEGEWLISSPQTIASFSAVGYFFGRELQKNLDVPVGLVQVAWGGTVAEAWMSRESLAGVDEFKPIVDRADKVQRPPAESGDESLRRHARAGDSARDARGDLVSGRVERQPRRAICQTFPRADRRLAVRLGPRRFSVPVRATRALSLRPERPGRMRRAA